jgi:hypothetical protein
MFTYLFASIAFSESTMLLGGSLLPMSITLRVQRLSMMNPHRMGFAETYIVSKHLSKIKESEKSGKIEQK